MSHRKKDLKALAQAVIQTEITALSVLPERIDEQFVAACETILECKGRVIVSGMGKSGHIGNKMAATLASTGTPAFFVHPGEASHGDLGMIVDGDVVILLSNSGSTDELLSIMPVLRRLDVRMIAMTGHPDSEMARAAHFHIDTSVDCEACPLGLAPTSSTTAALVMGDALAISLLEARGFTAEDFARSHPGGRLGKRLLVHVQDIMHTGAEIPKVLPQADIRETILEITRQGLGMTTVVDENDQLLGIFTDGDLRRSFENSNDMRGTQVKDLMTRHSMTISPEALAVSALNAMQDKSITVLPVVQEDKIVGIIHMHDLLRAGIV
ncbi:MAG: Arabinose 5-phosphate isomerase (EC [uncultured Thiotrichaceae bacterium]|uniref:Arabinose 5-phosphate isomerase n=1 Tax=uncultured Thiotrichaceae bacterium TaxID=298394 RepID=A0A6S6TNS9_9GAMM|nr:MAG: Arabinose 5-phosphate isomerase (EC [uncultured Thiotrichaceae bacterium]